MYKVSENYLEALSEKVYEDRISGTITLKDGEIIEVSDDNLVKNSLKITKELCDKEYKIGSFNLSCLKMAVFDEGALGRDYSNAVITLSYHLKLKNDGEETVPLGIFIADGGETSRKRDKVYITAYDGGIYFDREPSESIRNMTATPTELITAICEECGAELGEIAESLPNADVLVNIGDRQIQTCRDAVMWCSALLCGYGVIDREGRLNIIPAKYSLEEDGTTITQSRSINVNERSSIYSTDTRAYIKYLTAYCKDEVRQYNSEYVASDEQAAPASYAMARNPLLSGKSEGECDKINKAWHKYIEKFKQRGVTARIFGDPAIDVGDTIGFYGGDIDQRGAIIGVVTGYEWKYRNYHDIYCAAAECGDRTDSECTTPSTKVRNQTEKRIDALSGGGSSSILSAVSFEKNRMYYNGETYHVQYGVNKRIMCVTKGDKYALISSTDPTDSRIEAATAVMKGLTEDWDLEFDYYGLEWAGGITLYVYGDSVNGRNLLEGYTGRVRCDWGDGTVDEETSHTYYNTGVVTVRIKLLDTVSGTITVNLGASQWNNSNNKLCTEQYIGARAYIGGSIENVQISHGQGVTHICFGEKIKSISGHGIYQIAEGYNEMGIPPFIENISDNAYFYSGIDYIYIPESCVSIGNYAFYYNSASEIEIEEKGDTLTIGDYAFSNTADTSAVFNRVDVIRIPARVIKGGTNDIFIRCSAGAVIFGRGRTEIPEYMCRAVYASPTFSEISKRPFFVFIPKTVKTIGNQFISDSGYSEYANNPVYIICEGKWNNITKASDWDGANGSRENVTIIENDELYRSADKIINTFVK